MLDTKKSLTKLSAEQLKFLEKGFVKTVEDEYDKARVLYDKRQECPTIEKFRAMNKHLGLGLDMDKVVEEVMLNLFEESLNIHSKNKELEEKVHLKLDKINKVTTQIDKDFNRYNKTINIKEINLKELYEKNKKGLSKYLYANKSKNYARETIRHLKILFSLDVNNIISIQEKIYGKYDLPNRTNNSFRVFLNFLHERCGADPNDIAKLKKFVKGGVDSKEDEYVPSIDEMNFNLQQIKKKLSSYELCLYYALIESGARWRELYKMITEYNPDKHIQISKEISCYKLFWSRGKKKSFYLFFKTSTLNYLVDNIEIIRKNPSVINNYQEKLKRNKIIPIKYPRKFVFTQMISSGIDYNIADLFEGRTSLVSAKHYLGKEEILTNEYKKYLNEVLNSKIIQLTF